jgi:pimeloyl-ACP methyl ester carboxylesterase
MASPRATGAPLGDVPSMVRQVDAAVAEILKLHGGQRINLVAHSAGTFVAGLYVETHPDRVARLVFFGALAPYDKPTDESAVTVRYADVSPEEELEAFEPKVRDTRQLDPVMFDAWAKAYLATDPQSSSRNPPAVRVPTGMIAAFVEMHRNGRLPYDPHNITTPVLIIQGEWDAVSPPAAGMWVYERLASPLKRFVIISQAGHRAHLERNRWQLYRETESFLNGGDESNGQIYPRR